MSSRKKLIADLFFGIQIISAFVLCGSQFFRLLEITQGQLLSMILLVEAFLFVNFLLAIKAHRVQSSRVTRQTLLVYLTLFVLMGFNVLAFFLNGEYQWSRNDTVTSILVLCGIVVVFIGAKIHKIELQDPMLKSLLAMIFKALPQFMMAFRIAQIGGAGVPAAVIISGHITILTRIGQIWFGIREAEWDRNRIWLCASETVNEISWITVSIIWIIWLLTL